MYASTGVEMESRADDLLRNLCYADDRDPDYQAAREDLLSRYGKLGVTGPFTAMFDRERCQAEVASVYAEVFSRLGYLKVEHIPSPAQWAELTASLGELLDGKDMRLSEAERNLGPAPLTVDRRILCYPSPHPSDGWIFIDGHEQHAPVYDPAVGRYVGPDDHDPLVRSARRSAGGFEDGLVLTRYGKMLRWGQGWWIDHPDPAWSADTLMIAAQLRELQGADPSQQPGRSRRTNS